MRQRKIFFMLAVIGLLFLPGAIFDRSPVGKAVLVMDLGGDVPETVAYNPLMNFFGDDPITLLDKLTMLESAVDDPSVSGVVVRVTDAGYSLARAQELRQAVLNFRESSDKSIYAVLELEAGGNLEYFLGTAADKVYVSPASNLGLTGLSVFRFYLGGLWEKIYVDIQVDKIDEYKSMADMLARRDMSDSEREMMDSILDSLFSQFVSAIAESRSVSEDQVKEWIDHGWLVTEKYREVGAIDGMAYVGEVVEMAAGTRLGARIIPEREYLQVVEAKRKASYYKRVAVVFAVGNIITGEQGGSPFGGGTIIASDTMIEELREVKDDKTIDAVIFRVDSGGGSALASDLIWNAIRELREEKPVIVSMGDAAASGGYYISCGADAIVAQPGTMTGSIGILTAKFSLEKLIAKIGINTETLKRGEFADMDRIDSLYSEAEMQRIHNSIASLYDLFLTRVAEGRKMGKDEVNEVGRGRVWTGAQAKERGLVDHLGGYREAIMLAKGKLGLKSGDQVTLIYKHERVSFWKFITGRVETYLATKLFSAEEMELIEATRFRGMYKPGQPLALMPAPIRVK